MVAPVGVAVAVGTQILVVIIHFAMKVCFIHLGTCQVRVFADWIERENRSMCHQLHYDSFCLCKSPSETSCYRKADSRSMQRLARPPMTRLMNVSLCLRRLPHIPYPACIIPFLSHSSTRRKQKLTKRVRRCILSRHMVILRLVGHGHSSLGE